MGCNVKFLKEVKIKKDRTILELAKDCKLKIKAPCKGKGKCGKCVVKVLNGKVSKASKAEKKILSEEKIKKGYRLACEARIKDNVTIILKD